MRNPGVRSFRHLKLLTLPGHPPCRYDFVSGNQKVESAKLDAGVREDKKTHFVLVPERMLQLLNSI